MKINEKFIMYNFNDRKRYMNERKFILISLSIFILLKLVRKINYFPQ